MRKGSRWTGLLTLTAATGVLVLSACGPQETAAGSEGMASSAMTAQEGLVHDGQELYGHYEQPEPWPRPLPDDDHSHDGWTWGSMGAVYAENADKIWIAMRGELPLPPGNAPWTPYALIEPFRGNASPNDDNGVRGYERRYLHVMIAVNSDGELR